MNKKVTEITPLGWPGNTQLLSMALAPEWLKRTCRDGEKYAIRQVEGGTEAVVELAGGGRTGYLYEER
jgi:hypothetical protein